MTKGTQAEQFTIKGHEFELLHVNKQQISGKHSLSFCAGSRVVKEEQLEQKIPGLYRSLWDDGSNFIYSCYVTSPFLDERVRSERTGFDIETKLSEIFSEPDICWDEIYKETLERIKVRLEPYLKDVKEAAKERVFNFVATSAPRYRPILGRMPQDSFDIDPQIPDKELELHLHKQLVEIEQKHLAEGHDLLKPDGCNAEEYHQRIDSYLQATSDLKKSDLAGYVSHRRVVLDLLARAISLQSDGKYSREDMIHKLIMPMTVDSNQVLSGNCNLWLIDERLAFHHYLGSDKTLKSMPITEAEETKEPDIMALNIYDNPLLVNNGGMPPLASITIIEIKRPGHNDATSGQDKNPITQALDYLEKIREGGVRTTNGRIIPKSEEIPGFCYILCDMTKSMIKHCKQQDLRPTSDNMGYYGYNGNYGAYIEVISFDRLVIMAKERNRAFFDKLGLPVD